MYFCTNTEIEEFVKDKSVIVVGSGPTIKTNEKDYIDSHDIVVRVNNYKILDSRTGFRTDIHYSFYGQSIKKDKQDLIQDGVKFCICKCPNAKFMDSQWHNVRGKIRGTDFRYIYALRKHWWFCSTYVPSLEEFMETFNLLGGRIPTTGFSAILKMLSYKPSSLALTGFDFFESKIHNVDEAWRQVNQDDPIGHSPRHEKKWLLNNYKKYNIILEPHLLGE
jgi:hypothetical protein